jgi:uncharacterized protein (DUF2336 family)
MSTSPSLIHELEPILKNGSPRKRAQALERITALFLDGASRFNEDLVRVFDDIFVRLMEEIELTPRTELARRLAPVGNAPTQVVARLAKDDDISVAGPLLQQSKRLAETDLVAIAEAHGQEHLLAISNRAEIAERVSNVLVWRGDAAVARSLAENQGARISYDSFTLLLSKAEKDEALVELLGQRPDIPPPLFRELVLNADAALQQRLLALAKPETRAEIESVLACEMEEMRGTIAPRDYRAAERSVAALHREGRLNEAQLVDFAKAGRYEETVAALAELCAVPIGFVDRLMSDEGPNPILVLCKWVGWEWPTARAIIGLRPGRKANSSRALDAAHADFERLTAERAWSLITLWLLRPKSPDPIAELAAMAA